MTINKMTKINQILLSQPDGVVWLASWLEKAGISRSLQEHYRKMAWFEPIGTGAYKRTGQKITWEAGVYALQKQALLPIHVGARTALSLQGLAHYVRTKETVFIFASKPRLVIPKWFKYYDWEVDLECYTTSFLPDESGLIAYNTNKCQIQISSPERAILEYLYLAPKHADLVECYHIMQGLLTLRPQLIQQLLESCKSIKVKRLFMYMSQKTGHQWITDLNKEKISLGAGKRSIVAHGSYIPEYQITIPQELKNI